MDIKELRAKYPEYNDLDDEKLIMGFHSKFYSDIPIDQFKAKLGYKDSSFDLGSAASAVGRTALGIAGAVPQGLRAIGEAATGDLAGAWDRSASSNPTEWLPEAGDKTKQYQEKIGHALEYIPEAIGKGAENILGNDAEKIRKLYGDEAYLETLKGNAAIRTGAAALGNFVPLIPFKGKGKAKLEDKPSVDRRASLDKELDKTIVGADTWKEINDLDAQLKKAINPYRGKETKGNWLDENNMPVRETMGELKDYIGPDGPTVSGYGISPRVLDNRPLQLDLPPAVDMSMPVSRAGQAAMEPGRIEPGQPGNLPRDTSLQGPEPRTLLDVGTELGATPFEPKAPAASPFHAAVEQARNERQAAAETVPATRLVEHLQSGDPQMLLRELDLRIKEAHQAVPGAAKRARELESKLQDNGWTGQIETGKDVGLWKAGKGDTLAPIEKSGTRDSTMTTGTGKPFDPSRGSTGRFKSQSGISNRKTGKQSGALDLSVFAEFPGKMSEALSKLTDSLHNNSFWRAKFPEGSILANADGTPRVLLHGSKSVHKFDSLDPQGDIGVHLGSVAPSHAIMNLQLREHNKKYPHLTPDQLMNTASGSFSNGRVYPQVIKNGKLLKADIDVGPWHAPLAMLLDFSRDHKLQKVISDKMSLKIYDWLSRLSNDNKTSFYEEGQKLQKELLKELQDNGYVGIQYPNAVERLQGVPTDSYVIFDPKNIKSIYDKEGFKNLGQTRVGKGQRGSVPDVGESPLLKGLFKAFSKKAEVEPTKFEQAASTEQATKALPGTGKVFDGVSRVSDNPVEVLQQHADSINPDKDLTSLQLKMGTTVQSGANLKARNTQNPFVKFAYQAYDASHRAAALFKEAYVDPIAKLESKVGKGELTDLAYLARKVEGTSHVVDKAFLERHGFSENAINFWDAVQKGLDAKFQHTNETLNRIGKEAIEARNNYFASTFKGQYKAIVRDKESGQPIFVLAEKTPRKLDKLLEKFKATKGKEFDFDVLNFDYVKHNEGQVEFAMNEFNRLAEKGDPRVQAMKSLYEEYQKQTASYNKGGNQHLKAKSREAVGGAEGYRIDRSETQNAVDFWKAQLEYIEKGFMWGENQKMFNNIGEVIKGIEEKMPNTATYMQEYRLNALGVRRNTLGKMSDILEKEITNVGIPVRDIAEWSKGTLNSMLLGGPTNVVFAATQLIQVINAAPDLRIMAERRGMSAAEMAISASKSVNFTSPLSIEAMKWAKDNHVARSAVFGDTVNLGSSQAARTASSVGAVWNGLPKLADAGGRGYVFLNAVHMLMDSGMSKTEAFHSAADLTNRAMVDYRPAESPMAMSSGGLLGNTSLFLMKYPANWWNQFFSHLSNKDVTSFGALLTAVGLTAGAMGLPGIEQYEAIRGVWNNLFGAKGYRLPSANELILKSGMPQWAAIGPLSTTTGVDFSSKTGMRDTVGNSVTDVLMPGSGFAGKAVAGVGGAVLDPTNTEKWKSALHAVMPTSAKGITEKSFYTDSPDSKGKTLFRSPTTGEGEYRRNEFDRNIRMFGGRSTDEALAKSKDFANKTESKEKNVIKTEVIDSLVKQLRATNNPLKQGKLVQDAARVYAKMGGDAESFNDAVVMEWNKAMTTPEERTLMQTNPQKLKQATEYGYGSKATAK